MLRAGQKCHLVQPSQESYKAKTVIIHFTLKEKEVQRGEAICPRSCSPEWPNQGSSSPLSEPTFYPTKNWDVFRRPRWFIVVSKRTCRLPGVSDTEAAFVANSLLDLNKAADFTFTKWELLSQIQVK